MTAGQRSVLEDFLRISTKHPSDFTAKMSVRTYNPSVRVGNWNEDIQLEEVVDLSLFLLACEGMDAMHVVLMY